MRNKFVRIALCISAVILGIVANSLNAEIALIRHSQWLVQLNGLEVGGVRVCQNSSTYDLRIAVARDTSLTANEAIGYYYAINSGKNPYSARIKELENNADEKILKLTKTKNTCLFFAGLLGLLFVVTLFGKNKDS